DAADDADQRGLARAVRAEQREDLAAADREVDVLQRLEAARIHLVQPAHDEDIVARHLYHCIHAYLRVQQVKVSAVSSARHSGLCRNDSHACSTATPSMVGSSRRSVTRASRNATTEQPAMPPTIGKALPSRKRPTTAITAAPVTNCSVPISAEAVPAIGPCRSSASTAVVGITRPRNP